MRDLQYNQLVNILNIESSPDSYSSGSKGVSRFGVIWWLLRIAGIGFELGLGLSQMVTLCTRVVVTECLIFGILVRRKTGVETLSGTAVYNFFRFNNPTFSNLGQSRNLAITGRADLRLALVLDGFAKRCSDRVTPHQA